MALPDITATARVEWHPDSSWNPFDNGYYTINGKRIDHDELMALAKNDPESYREYITELNRMAERGEKKSAGKAKDRTSGARRRNEDKVDAADATDWIESWFTLEQGDVEDQLRTAGANMEDENVKRFIREFDGFEEDIPPEVRGALIGSIAQKYASPGVDAYAKALELGGFEEEYSPPHALQHGDVRTGRGHYRPEVGEAPATETSGDFMRFKNGVIVDQTTGDVLYEPGSAVPGSPGWRQAIVRNWSDEKAQEWRTRLYKLGYDVDKKGGMDVQLLQGLQAYWTSRYQMGGEEVPLSVAAHRDEREKLVNVREEFGATIRNDIRETYRRIYGTDPTDGEVEALSSTVFDTAMKLQRAKKGNFVQEAVERNVEKMEGSPEARLLTDAEEENTRLRDSLETAISATRSLAG